MDELSTFERRLAAGLEAYAGSPRSIDAAAMTRTAAARAPVRRWVVPGLDRQVNTPHASWRLIGAVALLVVSVAAGVLFVGSRQSRVPAVVHPAGNGLIAYERTGDIYVGDPTTGTTWAIIREPTHDARPVFSPDGSYIAFVHLDPSSKGVVPVPLAVVIARTDGTHERVISPERFGRFHEFLAWTPDASAIVVNHEDTISVLDVIGASEPRELSPPLSRWPGAAYFNANDQVALMFRPPIGDRVLSYGYHTLDEWTVDGTFLRHLISPADSDPDLYFVAGPVWSPDVSMIAFDARPRGSDAGQIFVLDADGSDLRAIGAGGTHAWSPDSRQIAFERPSFTGDGSERDETVIVIVDLESGTERVLDVTRVNRKLGGTDSIGGGWFYEGWSWSPDGRSIVMLERRGTSPLVVDIETGVATVLPWVADSALSWQRASAN